MCSISFPASPQSNAYRLKVTFRDAKGTDIKTVEVNEGDDLLSIAHEHDIDLEGQSLVCCLETWTDN